MRKLKMAFLLNKSLCKFAVTKDGSRTLSIAGLGCPVAPQLRSPRRDKRSRTTMIDPRRLNIKCSQKRTGLLPS